MTKKEFFADVLETIGCFMALAGLGWFFVEIFLGWLRYYNTDWLHIVLSIVLLGAGCMLAQWGSEDYWDEQSYIRESPKRAHKAH